MARKKVEELGAKVTVEDKASKEFERISKSVQKTHNELMRMKVSMEKLRAQSNRKVKVDVDTKQATANVSRLDKTMRVLHRTINDTIRVAKGLGSITSSLTPSGGMLGLGAIGGVAGAGYAGKVAFDNTFLQAANFEMSNKTIQAMFNNKAKSDLYVKQMEQMAIGSPLLNSQDIFGNSKSFIALSKEQGQLDQMWDLAERLLAVDPKQGVEGAVFALRELFSGDSKSMAERFELSKSVLNDIKNLPIEQQLKELDKYFNKMGMTKKLVNEMGDTTLGVWNQIKETMQVGLRRIGDPAVKIIKPLLDDINKGMQEGKLNNFIKIGQDMASSIANGFVTTARGVGGWIQTIYNDPEFQKLTSLQAKIGFVFDDIHQRFQEWLASGGQEKINQATSSLIVNLADSIIMSQDKIIQVFETIGSAAGQALASKASEEVRSRMSSFFTDFGITIPGTNFKIKPAPIRFVETIQNLTNDNNGTANKSIIGGRPKAFGMSRVPRNNFPALLHEGERVLTKQQANQEKLGGRSGVVLNINGPININDGSDYQSFLSRLTSDIEKTLVGYGGA